MANDYELVRKKRILDSPLKRSPNLPPSDKKTLDPKYLLQHEQHFDPNVVTPEMQMDKNPSLGGQEPIKKA